MKYFIMILALMFCVAAFAEPRMESRIFSGVDDFYVVQFEYNDSVAYYPAITGKQVPHWNARITVFKIVDKKQKQIGAPFDGVFTNGKCYEDSLPDLIRRAKDGIWH